MLLLVTKTNNINNDTFFKVGNCTFPMNPHVRLLIGLLVRRSVKISWKQQGSNTSIGAFVMIYTKYTLLNTYFKTNYEDYEK